MGQFHLDGREEVDHQCKSVLWEGGAFSDTQIRYTYLVRIIYTDTTRYIVLCAFLALDLDSLNGDVWGIEYNRWFTEIHHGIDIKYYTPLVMTKYIIGSACSIFLSIIPYLNGKFKFKTFV